MNTHTPEQLTFLADSIILDSNGKKYYEGFDASLYGNSLEPGSMPAPYFYDWVANETSNRLGTSPVLGIEVGSFLGYSAIGFAKKLKEKNKNSKLICVDTWLGSVEHFGVDNPHDVRLGWKFGYPSMYHKFISNVIYNDVQDIIIPLPFPSVTASKILTKLFTKFNIKADFAYIDGSHEEDEVYMDLYNYYGLINDGAYLCGDDWPWKSVSGDVIKFCDTNGFKVGVLDNNVHWVIKK